MTRSHTGINQKTGKLNKGYKYTGEKTKNGLSKIVKTKKTTGEKTKLKAGLVKIVKTKNNRRSRGVQKGGMRKHCVKAPNKTDIKNQYLTLKQAFLSDLFVFVRSVWLAPAHLPNVPEAQWKVTLKYNGPVSGVDPDGPGLTVDYITYESDCLREVGPWEQREGNWRRARTINLPRRQLPMYMCNYDCGFESVDYDEVAAHELICPHRLPLSLQPAPL